MKPRFSRRLCLSLIRLIHSGRRGCGLRTGCRASAINAWWTAGNRRHSRHEHLSSRIWSLEDCPSPHQRCTVNDRCAQPSGEEKMKSLMAAEFIKNYPNVVGLLQSQPEIIAGSVGAHKVK